MSSANIPSNLSPFDDDRIAFRQHLGIKVAEATLERAVLSMPWQAPLANRRGDVHGGALTTLIDTAISTAIVAQSPGLEAIFTIELSVRYLAAASGDLTATGKVLHIGGRVAFGQGDVHDSNGNLVATGQASYLLRRNREKAGQPAG